MTRTEGLVGPDELGARFAECVAAGDLDGIMQLYAADAVVSLRGGREAAGRALIRAAFAAALASGMDVAVEQAGPAIVTGTLACTTSVTADGRLCTQVARQEPDGTWRWVRDGFRLRDLVCAADGQVQPRAEGDGPGRLAEVA
jgi:ketosteroid isomerase-like protein